MTTPVARPRARTEQTASSGGGQPCRRHDGPASAARRALRARSWCRRAPAAGGRPSVRSQPGSRRRMAFLAALVIVALAVFGGRLVYVQGLRGASIAEQARDARLTSITLLGGRGEITDAEGVAAGRRRSSGTRSPSTSGSSRTSRARRTRRSPTVPPASPRRSPRCSA